MAEITIEIIALIIGIISITGISVAFIVRLHMKVNALENHPLFIAFKNITDDKTEKILKNLEKWEEEQMKDRKEEK